MRELNSLSSEEKAVLIGQLRQALRPKMRARVDNRILKYMDPFSSRWGVPVAGYMIVRHCMLSLPMFAISAFVCFALLYGGAEEGDMKSVLWGMGLTTLFITFYKEALPRIIRDFKSFFLRRDSVSVDINGVAFDNKYIPWSEVKKLGFEMVNDGFKGDCFFAVLIKNEGQEKVNFEPCSAYYDDCQLIFIMYFFLQKFTQSHLEQSWGLYLSAVTGGFFSPPPPRKANKNWIFSKIAILQGFKNRS